MHDYLKIQGNTPLKGSIKASGAKNAITKMLVASLISDKKCFFKNVPNIGDVEITVHLCQEIGMEVKWDREKKEMEVVTKEIKTSHIPQKFSGANRIPILLIGSLLGRTRQDILVPTVGGDKLGKRPVDFHMQALRKLGAIVEYQQLKNEGVYFARCLKGLFGDVIELPYPSVGATENAILAAIRAKGTTIIKNAALEPEVIDLILFLQKMGAQIMIDSDRTIRIEGTDQFYETKHTVLCDRNEMVSYALAAISTKGDVFIEGASQITLIPFLNFLRKIQAGFEILPTGIRFYYQGSLKGNLHIETDVHPGFMTDWQQPFCVMLTQALGSSVIHETVYENRFGYAKVLKEMGADIELFTSCLGHKKCRFELLNHHHSLIIKGPTKLHAKNIAIPDLRAGFAYVMAALLAENTSYISNVHYLDRGYEDFEQKLTFLGASIERISLESALV